MEKRNCIFTGKEANSKLTITTDNHNWAKNVPCTKEYLASRDSEQLNELEIRLVELFYQQELCRARVENYEAQMAEIRSLIKQKPGDKGYTDNFTQRLKSRRPLKEIVASIEEINNRKPDFDSIREETAPVEVPEGAKKYIDTVKKSPSFKETMAYMEKIKEFNKNSSILKGENHIKEPETEYEPEECPNPDCSSILQHAPGIGPFCPNKECDVGDGPDVWKKEEDEKLTESEEDVKVEKKVVKKKLSSIWD